MDYPRLWAEVFAPRMTAPVVVGPPDYTVPRSAVAVVVVEILGGPYARYWTPALLEQRLGLAPHTAAAIDRMLAARYPAYDLAQAEA